MIIGIAGKAQHGKSTVAKYLVEKYGYTELSSSKVLKHCIYVLNPIVDFEISKDGKQMILPIRYQELITNVGLEKAKKNPEVRRILNAFGTDIGRDIIDKDIWLKKLQEEVNKMKNKGITKIVIADIRFDNDSAIADYIIKVIREFDNGLGINANHKSESGISDELINSIIHNKGTLDDLYESVDSIIKYDRKFQ